MQLQPPPETEDIEEIKDWLRLLYEWLKSPVFNKFYMNPSTLPSDANKCDVIYDEDADRFKYYDGATWQDITRDASLDDGQLDDRYFTEAEHLNVSAGSGDAGKPIILDADGDLDSTMINSADVDHDSTTNFLANEHINHTSVTLTAGTGLTGGGDISADRTFNVMQQSHIADASAAHAITDPADSPVDADALRDDLVANAIPDMEAALNALGTKINALLAALETAEILASS